MSYFHKGVFQSMGAADVTSVIGQPVYDCTGADCTPSQIATTQVAAGQPNVLDTIKSIFGNSFWSGTPCTDAAGNAGKQTLSFDGATIECVAANGMVIASTPVTASNQAQAASLASGAGNGDITLAGYAMLGAAGLGVWWLVAGRKKR